MSELYVGLNLAGPREVFRSRAVPTDASHGHLYGCCIGPFRTRRGAVFMAAYGRDNPHCRCVAEAERLGAKLLCKTPQGYRLRN